MELASNPRAIFTSLRTYIIKDSKGPDVVGTRAVAHNVQDMLVLTEMEALVPGPIVGKAVHDFQSVNVLPGSQVDSRIETDDRIEFQYQGNTFAVTETLNSERKIDYALFQKENDEWTHARSII